ncbi:MAG: PilZ domain-containing protein [Myxococcales bacterium]|nr:PilZ domain-containing protein [Myxococcales bacterium]
MHSVQPLGRLLVTSGLLTQQALDEVLALQKTDGRRLGELLAEKGLVRPHQLAQFLSHQLACPWVSLQRVEIAREAVEALPPAIALKHHMVPVHLRVTKGATTLYVAMDEPTDDIALAAASAAAAMPVKAMVALSSEIRAHLDRLYGSPTPAPEPSPSVRERAPSFASVPSIAVKDDASGKSLPSRPPKPPPPKPSAPLPSRDEPSILDVVDVIEEDPSSRPSPRPKVLVVEAKESLVVSVRAAAARFGGDAIGVTLADAASAAAAHSPCALVVTEDVYANERSGLDLLALETGALLVVSSEAFEGRQLEGLLEDAIKRWRRSSYEKGAVLEGRYELLRDVGGRVAGSRWEVRHLRTARRSLLKVGVRIDGDESDAESVRREQPALASFLPPGSVDLRDAGTTERNDPYIVVEMLEGRTLEGLVAARGALPTAEACSVIRQIADVLAAAHDASIRHGEVRPENVLIVRDAWGVERVKLVNWEAAIIADGAADVAIDLAGIGACAFLALAGRTRNEGEAVRSIGSGSGAPQELPPALASVIARTLGGAGADRFTSTKELVEALDAAAPPEPTRLHLLDAKPERRGTSVRPGPRSASVAPPAEEEEATEKPAPQPSSDATELRRYPRAAYRTPVRVEVPGIGAVDGRSEDISERGLFVVTRGKIADGAQVTVRFALPIDGKVVSESGVVRWSRAPHSGDGGGAARAVGIELTSPGPESVKQISRYVSFMAAEK